MSRQKKWTSHVLLNGETLQLGELAARQREYLDDLARDAGAGEDFFSLLMRVKGPGSVPLGGGGQVTRDVMKSPLYQVALDIVNRAGISQGNLAPPANAQPAALLSVPEAASLMGVSRQAVNKAIATGRLLASRIGGNFVVKLEDARGYGAERQVRKVDVKPVAGKGWTVIAGKERKKAPARTFPSERRPTSRG